MKNPVVCRKRKFDGTEKSPWHGDLVEATPEWVVVFFERPPHQTGTGAEVAYAFRYYSEAAPLSILVSFDEQGRVLEYQCDAGLPARQDGHEISFVDLDLDLMATPDLESMVRDEATFAIHQFVMSYPEDVVAMAHAGIDLAAALVRRRAPPFDGSAETLLGRVLASRGPL